MKKFAFLLGLLLACSGTAHEGAEDTGRSGRGDDVSDPRGRTDTAIADTSTTDAGPADTGTTIPDATIPDATVPDVTVADTRPIDTGQRDTTIGRECAQVTAQGDPLYAPIDIIWGIDTSGSMNEEIAIIEANLLAFVTFIEDSGLDVRVVMVADDSICVPFPLSGGGCPTADTDSDRYRHVRRTIGSSNAYDVLVDAYPDYSDFLRRDAIKHFVVVSDDESDEQPTWFRDQIRSAGINYFIFHAIVSLTGTAPPFGQGCTGPHGDAEAKGDKYMLLAEMTDGTSSSICEPDWSDTFDGIATNVISGAVLPCSYGVPDVGQGREVVYDEVAVFLNTNRLTRHTDVNGCSDRPGWYFDNNDAPTEIHLCAGLCGAGFEDVEVNIEFGCVKG